MGRAETDDSLDRRQRLSDALLRAGEGSEAALAEVYSLTAAKLFGICLRILGDRGEAEDVLQEVYVSVWRRAADFDPGRASPVTWLATLARNRAIDMLRSGARRRASAAPIEAAVAEPDQAGGPASELEASSDRARLLRCIGELERRQSNAIRTAFFEGLSYADLAEREGVPLGTMKSWVRRGLLRLRDCMER